MQTIPESISPPAPSIEFVFPELFHWIQQDLPSTELQEMVKECIQGSGDEVFMLHQNQFITLPPHTMYSHYSASILVFFFFLDKLRSAKVKCRLLYYFETYFTYSSRKDRSYKQPPMIRCMLHLKKLSFSFSLTMMTCLVIPPRHSLSSFVTFIRFILHPFHFSIDVFSGRS